MSRVGPAALAAAALLIVAGPAAADRQKADHVYGPEPSWDEFRQIAEAALTARLIDPDSARITWLSGIHKGDIKPILSPRIAGYVACGSVNAKNRLGGYTGGSVFMVVIDYGRALFVDMDHHATGPYDEACAKALNTGLFPPAPQGAGTGRASATAASPPAPASADIATLSNPAGLSLRAMPEGAYVAAITPGSPAQLAGLKPGMVITSVNAIPLAGMGEAMRKVVDAAGSAATLTLVGGTTIRLGGSK